MREKENLKSNYIYSLCYQIISIVIPIITTPYLSRVLKPSGIGVFDFTNSNVSYFILLGVMGLGTYGQLEIAKHKDNKKSISKIFTEIMIIRIVMHLISLALFIGVLYFFSNKYLYIYLVQCFLIIASMIDVTWFLQGIERFKLIAVTNSFIKIGSLILVFVVVKEKSDLLLYVLIISLSTLLCNILYFPFLKNNISKLSFSSLSFKKHLMGTLMFFIPSIASVIITYLDKSMIGFILKSEAENGYYAQAYKIEIVCFSLFSSLLIVMRSRMAYLSHSGDDDELSRLLIKSLRFVSFLSFPISLGTIAITNDFVPWFFGKGYDKVRYLLPVFSLWLIFKSHSNCILEEYIMAKGRQKLFNITVWIGTIANVVLNFLLIPICKSIGAAIASVIAEVIMFILAYHWSKKVVFLRVMVGNSLKYIFAAVMMSLVVYLVGIPLSSNFITTIIQISVGAVIYLLILVIFKDDMIIENMNLLLNKLKK